ncbi:dihydrofolate synthase/folylpolyglutamate synthase-like [Ylistrum balloti]|uniref:dihydrofolate synthase/folylpolyglutamate synthase-like n=1 Tax=Ylistrum balloti TaxID=509963 RepID=UPI002905E069|nr:dihydrofolate synthase/folylpolyglutamate synthase-like [Ylistrum balloti]
MFRGLSKALDWLQELPSLHYKHAPSNERMLCLLKHCGNPERKVRFVHITGSKGKSSTSQSLAYLLSKQGKRTGLFSSPHIQSYNERIKIDNQPISDDEFLVVINEVHTAAQNCSSQGSRPTFFEKIFSAALLYFQKKHCEWVVVEVGIGGLHDSTNVITPQLSIITNIELEHCDILGYSIEEITYEKAGIIKTGVPVLLGSQTHNVVFNIVRKTAEHQTSPLYIYDSCTQHSIRKQGIDGITATLAVTPCAYRGKSNSAQTSNTQVRSKALLTHIVQNQMLATLGLAILRKHAHTIETLPAKLYFPQSAQLPCRGELLHNTLYLDIAHTPQSLSNTLRFCSMFFSQSILLLGISQDKEHERIAKAIALYLPCFQRIIVTKAGSIKPQNPTLLYNALKNTESHFKKQSTRRSTLRCINDHYTAFEKALAYAKKKHAVLVICGSSYLCSDCRKYYLTEYLSHVS